MKIIRKFILIFLIISLMSGMAYAMEEDSKSNDTVVNRYETVRDIQYKFEINSGKASGSIQVRTAELDEIDQVVATIKFIKSDSGSTIKTWNNIILSGPDILNVFRTNKTYVLTQRGTYYMTAKIKLYKGTSLKETIDVKSLPDTY